MSNNTTGMRLDGNNNSLTGDTCHSNSGTGIMVDAHGNTITGLVSYNNTDYGIAIEAEGYDNTFNDCYIYNNKYGAATIQVHSPDTFYNCIFGDAPAGNPSPNTNGDIFVY